MSSVFLRQVVRQDYTTKAEDEYVIRGNDVLMKCKVPSFVSDQINVVGWVDNSGKTYQMSAKDSNFQGKNFNQ